MATVFAYLWDVSPEEFRRANEVTYFGSIWGIQAAPKRMRPRNRGTIVQVGSAMAYRGIPLQALTAAPSTASKVSSSRCGPS
jgi:NAD(P)-dependent dehydrogenase (short-subunit alcohol dehydrogenase family)